MEYWITSKTTTSSEPMTTQEPPTSEEPETTQELTTTEEPTTTTPEYPPVGPCTYSAIYQTSFHGNRIIKTVNVAKSETHFRIQE